jgi:hypothetical protein
MKHFLLGLVVAGLAGGGVLTADDFRFVVIGDTRPKFESEDFRVFEGLIGRINQRQPALVINLGDLIYGYGVLSKEKQWDKYQQTIQAFAVPYHQLPGNHDIYSQKARRIYERRFGRFYQSFDHGDGHFVLLNNCEEGRWGDLGPTQLAWLKADLRASAAPAVFVFLHFPVWEPERVAPRYYEFWKQTLHPLFRATRVRAVFGGHYHSYGPSRDYDGIRYFITGGGGAELRPEYRKAGGEHHFLEAHVRGTNLDLQVITERGTLTDAEADVLGGFEFADKYSSRVGLDSDPASLRTGVAGSIALHNPYRESLTGHAEWNFDATTFQLEPRAMSVNLPPGGATNFAFTLRVLRGSVPLGSLPWLEFNIAAGGMRHRFHRAVVLLRSLAAPYRPSLPTLDGRMTEWDDAPWVRLGDASAPPAEIRALHSKDTLVLAVAVPRVPSEVSEESGFPDALQVGFARRQGDAGFSGDFLRLGFASERGAVEARDRTPSRRSGARVPGVRGACRETGERTIFEIAIPTSLLRIGSPREERSLVVSLAFPLPEGGPNSPEPALPGPNTFAYQARYGGAALVPVHFVGMRLESNRPRK